MVLGVNSNSFSCLLFVQEKIFFTESAVSSGEGIAVQSRERISFYQYLSQSSLFAYNKYRPEEKKFTGNWDSTVATYFQTVKPTLYTLLEPYDVLSISFAITSKIITLPISLSIFHCTRRQYSFVTPYLSFVTQNTNQ